MRRKPRQQLVAALLALSLGIFGAHAWYLRRPRAWLWTAISLCLLCAASTAQVWWDSLWFYLLWVPATAAWLECLFLALQDPITFHARYNPWLANDSARGWANVMLAVITTLLGGTVLLYSLTHILIVWSDYMGWLDTSHY